MQLRNILNSIKASNIETQQNVEFFNRTGREKQKNDSGGERNVDHGLENV